jgi:hypothetical protein
VATNASAGEIHFIVVQRDDGLWSIGLGDDCFGPFETPQFAMAVAARRAA